MARKSTRPNASKRTSTKRRSTPSPKSGGAFRRFVFVMVLMAIAAGGGVWWARGADERASDRTPDRQPERVTADESAASARERELLREVRRLERELAQREQEIADLRIELMLVRQGSTTDESQ